MFEEFSHFDKYTTVDLENMFWLYFHTANLFKSQY